jgi:chemotaxis protein CheD
MSDHSIQRVLAGAAGRTARHTLHPGDVMLGAQGDQFETLLGSCVSVILTDPRRTVGVMSHIVHAGRAPAAADRRHTAYADAAFERMFELLMSRGIGPGLCEAYVYGGGNMFPDLVRDRHVGQSNAAWVLDALDAEGIQVLVHDLGRNAYRRLSWTVGTDEPQVTVVPV